MALYKRGFKFEQAVFGDRSHRNLFQRFGRSLTDFGRDVKDLIQSSNEKHPPTEIGECLYHQVERQLCSFGLDPEGLIFCSSVDDKVDLYGMDGAFYLPALFPHLVTIDAFAIMPAKLLELREKWIEEFRGDYYSTASQHTNLFLFKKGMMEWGKDNSKAAGEGFLLVVPEDFRHYARQGRWENQFILTPLDISTYERRRDFARLVAWYFAKVAKVLDHGNMALLSH